MVSIGSLGQALLVAKRKILRERLDAMTTEERRDLVDAARQESRWPPPPWLARHVADHSPERTPHQYAEWAQQIKRRPGTQVYALIHPIHANEALAFIDPTDRVLVWFDLESNLNLSCFYMDEPLQEFLQRQGASYWRLEDTERT